jgi:hypothetical protein
VAAPPGTWSRSSRSLADEATARSGRRESMWNFIEGLLLTVR